MFVCVYLLDVFSWCFLLRIAGRSVNAEILELWTSDSENLWNSLGIMEFSILKYRVSILVCNTRVSYKNHLWTNLLRSPWWKETHVLKRLKNGWCLTPFTRVSCHADASPELQVVEVKLPRQLRGPRPGPHPLRGLTSWRCTPFSQVLFCPKAEVWGIFELKWFWFRLVRKWRLYWLWSVSDFVLPLYWSMIYHLTSNF